MEDEERLPGHEITARDANVLRFTNVFTAPGIGIPHAVFKNLFVPDKVNPAQVFDDDFSFRAAIGDTEYDFRIFRPTFFRSLVVKNAVSAARDRFNALLALKTIGVPALEPAAWGFEKRFGTVRRSFFATKTGADGFALRELMDRIGRKRRDDGIGGIVFSRACEALAASLVYRLPRHLAKIHKHNVRWKNPTLGALRALRDIGGRFEFVFADVAGLEIVGEELWASELAAQDLDKLDDELITFMNESERREFLAAYTHGRPDAEDFIRRVMATATSEIPAAA